MTTSFAMPNVDPPPISVDSLESMFAAYRGRAYIDYNVNPAPTQPAEVAGMAERGVAAFKVFMVTDTGRDYPHMPGIGVHDHGDLMAIMERCAAVDVPLMVHPHDQGIMDHIEQGFWRGGSGTPRRTLVRMRRTAAWPGTRPSHSSCDCRRQPASGSTSFTSRPGGRSRCSSRRRRGAGTSPAEINPWALFLGNDWANIERLGSYALSYWVPEEHHQALWGALRDGTVDLVATDHAPHTREEKEIGWVDGWKAHTGTPSTQFYLSLLLDAAHAGELTLERVVEATATRPAARFGLVNKGRIAPGRDADLVLADLEQRHVITDDEVLSKCGWSPYAGREVVGVPVRTLLRGATVYERSSGIVGEPSGQLAARNR